MSADALNEYLRGIEEPKRSTLEALRRTILEIVPDAEQVTSYKVPAFRVEGRIVAGFAAFKDHLSYLPFSGSVLPALTSELEAACWWWTNATSAPSTSALPRGGCGSGRHPERQSTQAPRSSSASIAHACSRSSGSSPRSSHSRLLVSRHHFDEFAVLR